MGAQIDLVDTYFRVMASGPLKALVFFVALATGASIPGWLNAQGSVPMYVMWPLTVFGCLFTWGSAMPLFGIAYLCLFGCLYNFLVSEQTLRPMFWGFSICYVISMRQAGDQLWLAGLLYAILLGTYFWAPASKKIREYERRCI